MNIPFIGRLQFIEYLALLASLLFLVIELFVRIVTIALPDPIINFFYKSSKRLFNFLSSPSSKRSRNKHKIIVQSITKASDFVELCELHGYHAEEHVVHTQDGYFLGLHRLAYMRGKEDRLVNAGPGTLQKKVVFCMHGLLMNSEVWVCQTERERCLAFELIDQGYDVWFGNNRGNKYSKKSSRFAPTELDFWSFSIDDFAFVDIPESIGYILDTTHQPSLSYIGFSQGTAQAFASLSVNPSLNQKIEVFIALAPAMSPPGLSSALVDALTRASPNFIFLAFGRKAILGSAPMWEAVLYPPIFVRLVDMGTSFLFGWQNKNMSISQKIAAYPHLYSFTSTKSVVHWFQIIRNGKFQMYDDEVQRPFGISDTAKYYKVAKFPTKNIRTPIVLAYGGSDSLVDIKIMLGELPPHTKAHQIPHYEHLDFLWAQDVHEQVFPLIFETLNQYSGHIETHQNLISNYSSLIPSANNNTDGQNKEIDYGTDASEDTTHKHNAIPDVSISGSSPDTTLSTADLSFDIQKLPSARPEGWDSGDEKSSTVATSTPVLPDANASKEDSLPSTRARPSEAATSLLHSLTRKTSRSSLKTDDHGINIGTAKPATAVSMGEPLVGAGMGQTLTSLLRKKKTKKAKKTSSDS